VTGRRTTVEEVFVYHAIKGAVGLLDKGGDLHRATARRLSAAYEAQCGGIPELLASLRDIRKGQLLPDDALLSLIADVTESLSRDVALGYAGRIMIDPIVDTDGTEVGHLVDFDDPDSTEALFDDVVYALTRIIDKFLHYPTSEIEDAIETAAKRLCPVVIREWRKLVSEKCSEERRRLLAELDCADIAEMIEKKSEGFKGRKENGERLLTGKTNEERGLEEFKALIEAKNRYS
jgi:hypothetical protein